MRNIFRSVSENQIGFDRFVGCCLIIVLGLLPSCARLSHSAKVALDLGGRQFAASEQFAQSGTLVLSGTVPVDSVVAVSIESNAQKTGPVLYAPLIGYFPPSSQFLPADNETWLEIDRQTKIVRVLKGDDVVKQCSIDGSVSLDPGVYPLQHKEQQPLWYASDQYFTQRELLVPDKTDTARYLRGALGQYALFISPNVSLHSAPIWSEEVGGVQINRQDMSAVYELLPIGASILIK